MASEKFCLKWNDFEQNISFAFKELKDDKDFFDVTLACEDEEQVSAHKVILSACSPFFKNILRRNQHQHPLLYLKGVKYSDLQSVLNFMYHGEVNVAQEELNNFLSIAEELKVKGLTQGNNGGSTKRSASPPASKPLSAKRPRPPDPIRPPAPIVAPDADDDIQEVLPVKTEPSASSSYSQIQEPEQHLATYEDDSYADYNQYDDQQEYDAGALVDFNASGLDGNKELILESIEEEISSKMFMNESKVWQCTECGRESKYKTDITRHVESLHILDHPGYTCTFCGVTMKSRNSFRKHNCRRFDMDSQ